jgi:hypothetical protein
MNAFPNSTFFVPFQFPSQISTAEFLPPWCSPKQLLKYHNKIAGYLNADLDIVGRIEEAKRSDRSDDFRPAYVILRRFAKHLLYVIFGEENRLSGEIPNGLDMMKDFFKEVAELKSTEWIER